MKKLIQLLYCSIATLLKKQFNNLTMKQFNISGFSSLAAVALIGLILAVVLALVGTGTLKIPGSKGIPVSPLPVSEPIQDDTACNDPYNADCEVLNNPEDLTPAQIQKALERK